MLIDAHTHLTYQQTLETVRLHLASIEPDATAAVLGGNARRLLTAHSCEMARP